MLWIPETEGSNEYALQIEWTPSWDFGAPLPQVFSNGNQTYLTYLINLPDLNWDGSYVNMMTIKVKIHFLWHWSTSFDLIPIVSE